MNPIMLVLGGGAAFFGFKALSKKPVQGQTIITSSGVPIHVATPVPSAVTAQQAHAIVTAPSVHPAAVQVAVPHPSPNSPTGTTYAPPAAITQTAPGTYEMAPIVFTPTGTSSVAISTTLDVQKALNALGYAPKLAEDGKLGPMTITNIKAFQGKSGLVVDGNAGPATKAKLSEALTNLASSGSTSQVVQSAVAALTAGTSADATAAASPIVNITVVTNKDVQHALNLLGASPPLAEDGALGPKSVAAVKSFQLSHGLVADGVAGPKTKTGLSAALQAKGVSMHGDYRYPVMSGGQFGSCWG